MGNCLKKESKSAYGHIEEDRPDGDGHHSHSERHHSHCEHEQANQVKTSSARYNVDIF